MFAARCKAVGAPYAIARSVDEAERVLASWGRCACPCGMPREA